MDYRYIIILFLLFCQQASGQLKDQFYPKSYICQRASQPILVDGKLDDEDWQKASWTDTFVDIEGEIKPLPYYDTKVKMLWDDDYFYISAYLQEEHLWATYTDHDAVIYHENDFEVFIDPDGDNHNYYELEINALGTVWDLMLTKPYRDHGVAINSWEILGLKKGIYLDGTINNPDDKDKGWVVELAFPWSVLREASARGTPKNGDQWRVNFSRVHWKIENKDGTYSKMIDTKTNNHYPEYNWVWSPQHVIAMHQPETWGFVQFSSKNAGEKDELILDDAYKVKLQLKALYDAQHEHKKKKGVFAQKLTDLDLHNFKSSKDEFTSYTTPSFFEILHVSKYGKTWHISNDGRIWSTNQ